MLLLTSTLAVPPRARAVDKTPTVKPRPVDRLAWWRDARFGMFIHFGVYATLGRGEWVRSREKISDEAYQVFVDRFNPRDFDARAMARLAKRAGMKYAVMTAKHHDGFCLWDTKTTNFSAPHTPVRRDLVREYVEAFRAEGLKVGLYYSLIDWHDPDYPHFGDRFHPMREEPSWRGRAHDFNKYLDRMHAQIKELVTQYGKLDIFWFDFSYDKMAGEVWRATKLVDMVRRAQPQAILNNRLAGDGVSAGLGYGDFVTPEQGIPETPSLDAQGRMLPWETCLTLNNSWGYNHKDAYWKSPKQVVGALVNAVSKGGNLLLNVGPDGRGRIPPESVRVLEEVGAWLASNGDSIYGAGPADMAKPDWGRFTKKGKVLFAHVTDPPIGHLRLPGLREKVVAARVLGDGAQAYLATEFWGTTSGDGVWLNLTEPTHHTYPMPDPIDTVFSIELR
jgi:alpha-L-fucosidase